MTPAQRQLIDKASQRLEAEPRIEALWLAGSLGHGGGDTYSDVDLLACCAEGTAPAVCADLAGDVASIMPPLLVNMLFGGRVLNVVAQDWQRFDVSLIEAGELGRYDPTWLTLLFNRTGIAPSSKYPERYQATPESLLPIVNEFLRVLGLCPVVAGRQDYVVLMAGVEQLRRLTIDLMLEEEGIGPWARGGALSRRPLLSAAQYAELEHLPALRADRQSTLANHVALAGIFLSRARRLCAAVEATWPTQFERATRDHLRETLALDI